MMQRKKLWNPLGGRSNKEKKAALLDSSNGTYSAITNNGVITNPSPPQVAETGGKSTHQSRLSIFSSFSKGKAGILADSSTGGNGGSKSTGNNAADPVLLGIRRLGEGEELAESLVYYNQNGNREESCPQSSRSLLRPRRLPTRSYSLTLQPQEVSKYPSKWTSTKELNNMMVSDTPDGRPQGPTSLGNYSGGSETLPKIARSIQSSLTSASAKKSRPTSSKKKRTKKKSADTTSNLFFNKSSTLDSAGAVMLSRSTAAMAAAEIERFEREFVQPMLQKKSTADLNKLNNDEQNIMSLPPIHINDVARNNSTKSKSKMASSGNKMASDQLTMTSCESSSSANTSTATEQTVAAAVGTSTASADSESSPEQVGRGAGNSNRRRRRRERAPSSSTHSHVSDSNYDSGAFSRTSSPEISTNPATPPPTITHGQQPHSLPPLVSPKLVLALLRSGQANIVDGQLVLACLNAAGAESRFSLNSSQAAAAVRGANAEYSANGSFCLDKLDTTDGHLDLSHGSHQQQQQDLSYLEGELADLEISGLQSLPTNLTITTGMSSKENAVTISIGSTTKLQINEDEKSIENKFYSLSCLQQLNSGANAKFQSLTNFHAEHRESGRSRLKAPHMGTARLGTPPKERVATPPRSIERNKIAIGTPKTQLRRQKTDRLIKSSDSFHKSKSELISSEDSLLKDDVLWSSNRRAESTSSQDSSGVSSSASAGSPPLDMSCTCTSFVTVNGQHHCVIQYEEETTTSSVHNTEMAPNPQCKTIKISANNFEQVSSESNCDKNLNNNIDTKSNNNTHTAIVVNL